MRADRGDEGDLNRGQGRISRRVRQHDGLAKARPEGIPADYRLARVSACGAAGHSLWRRVGSNCWSRALWRRQRLLPKFKQMVAEGGPDPGTIRSGRHSFAVAECPKSAFSRHIWFALSSPTDAADQFGPAISSGNILSAGSGGKVVTTHARPICRYRFKRSASSIPPNNVIQLISS
jgi:hypothetical protein